MRWLWIDRFTEFHSGQSAVAVKNVSLAEDFFTEHFPGYPIMPASLMIEGMAQTGGILVGEVKNFQEKVILAKIPYARFFRDVFPGEQLFYHAELIDLREQGAVVRCQARIHQETLAECEIFFAHLDQNRSQQVFGDHNFVFSGELKQLLGLTDLTSKSPAQLPAAE